MSSGWIFTISSAIYVFEVKESIVDILTELRCLSDLDNPSQLSGLRGTDDSVSRIFEIFTLFVFSRSGNPLLIFLQSYHVWVTSENPGKLPVQDVIGGTGECVL